MALTGWPSYSDDDGTGQSGTAVDKVFIDSLRTSIEASVFSATNPTISPAALIDEVVAARGSKATLDARLDISLEEDGTLKSQASLATLVQLQSAFGSMNLLANDTFIIWPAGDGPLSTALPSYWTLASGTSPTCAREVTTIKVGQNSAKVANAGASTCTLEQALMDANAFGTLANNILRNRKIGFGCWVNASAGSTARITVNDGVTSTSSSYHTGVVGWEWLSVNHTISGSATALKVQLAVTGSQTAYFSGATALLGDFAPLYWMPSQKVYGTVHFPVGGTQTTGTNKAYFVFARPSIVKDVQLRIQTQPATQALIVDVNGNSDTANPPTFTTMCTTKPQIAAATSQGGAQPDGTYQRRCFAGLIGSTLAIQNILAFDIDQVGTGTAGSDLIVEVRCMQYARPLEDLLAADDI